MQQKLKYSNSNNSNLSHQRKKFLQFSISNQFQKLMSLPKFQVKAGRFVIDKQVNKVKPSKAKGKIIVERTQDQQTHFRWIDTETKIQQFDMIVFPMDAKFQPANGKSNTYSLKFETDTDVHFFWMQEKVEPQEVCKKINDIINFVQEEEPQPIVQEKPGLEQKPAKIEKMQPQKIEQPMTATQKPLFSEDFIARMTRNLQQAQKGPKQQNITHLEKIFNYETINKILNELTPEEKAQLIEYLPEGQQKLQFFDRNVRSAQFGQTLDPLSDALNSETALSIFAEMGVNQNHLKKYYGVHAFIKALVEWGRQQKK